MTKRVHFNEKNEIHDLVNNEPKDKVSKHTLDSDEEDDEKLKGGVLNQEDIEGQEDRTVDFDDDIKITPFNMEDEMDEGHFDSAGTFIFNKPDGIKDNWMDNIDWVSIRKSDDTEATEAAANKEDKDDDDDEGGGTQLLADDKISAYKEMLSLMQAGESVLKAVKRFSGGSSKTGAAGSSASQRWKKKKTTDPQPSEVETSSRNIPHMLRLTELADRLLQSGEFDAYEDTFEKIQFRLRSFTTTSLSITGLPANTSSSGTADAELDMFADELDKQPVAVAKGESSSKLQTNGSATTSDPSSSAEVFWDLKRFRSDSAPIEGPYPTSQLMKWSEEGVYDTEDVFVRRTGTNSEFYPRRRIDFDLYT